MKREDVLSRAAALASGYRLSPPPVPSGGGAGFFAGKRDGQSVDFHDYRQYLPGDDLRRVDWRAYARNGQMHIKLFREEISPTVEIHLDTSASMAAYAGKEAAALFLAAFLRHAALAAEAKPVLCRDGQRFTGGEFPAALIAAEFDKPFAPAWSGVAASTNSIRFFLSDYLFGGDLPGLLARQAAGSLAFTPVMVLAESEIRPPWRGPTRLREIENASESLDLAIGDKEIAAYQKRLAAHKDNVESLARRHGGALVSVETADAANGDGFAALAGLLARERLVTPC